MKNYSVIVNGNEKTWAFEVVADPQSAMDWEADGLTVHEIINTIPCWLPVCLHGLWVLYQDIWGLKFLEGSKS